MNLKNTNLNNRFFVDLKILIPSIILSLIGILSLLSTTILPSGNFGEMEIVYKQIIFLIIGLLIFFTVSFFDLNYLKYWQILLIIYAGTIALLLVTLLWGPTINNVNRWLIVGGVQIQPSEIAKVVVILMTAIIISQKDKVNEWLLLLISFLLTVPIVVLIYLEPDGSMSLLTLVLWFIISFLGLSNPLRNTVLLLIITLITGGFLLSAITENNLWYLLLVPGTILAIFSFYSKNVWKNIVLSTVILALILGFVSLTTWDKVLKDYQKDRIVAFLNPSSTEGGIGFNVNQARIAIGSGRIFGKGFGNGTQSKRDFLPEHQTDFMFASFAEEFGLVGSILLLFFYGFLISYSFIIAMKSISEPVLSLIAIGVGIKLLLEVFINIGTNTGAIPATGIPLPLMSAGGSITVITFLCIAFVNNISKKFQVEELDKSKTIIDYFEN